MRFSKRIFLNTCARRFCIFAFPEYAAVASHFYGILGTVLYVYKKIITEIPFFRIFWHGKGKFDLIAVFGFGFIEHFDRTVLAGDLAYLEIFVKIGDNLGCALLRLTQLHLIEKSPGRWMGGKRKDGTKWNGNSFDLGVIGIDGNSPVG